MMGFYDKTLPFSRLPEEERLKQPPTEKLTTLKSAPADKIGLTLMPLPFKKGATQHRKP